MKIRAHVITADRFAGDLHFEDVTFAYEHRKPCCTTFRSTPQPGSVTALVGSSGSGKSTIIGLIAAFHKPNSGKVLVDGVDLATVGSSRTAPSLAWCCRIRSSSTDRFARMSVLQAGRHGRRNPACLPIARVDEFAEQYEQKYDTIIGERGVKLSGGQRQRVSIARAILANPRILILDEATSSLDSESEALIQQGLSYLMRGRTTFVIAHRLSTIRRADQILVVEDGRIVERGKHQRSSTLAVDTTSSTPGSMVSSKICFSPPAKATASRRATRCHPMEPQPIRIPLPCSDSLHAIIF